MTESKTKLNDENYDAWEFEMKAELKKKGVWAIVSGEEVAPLGSAHHKTVKAWLAKRDVAAGEIITRLDTGQFAHVRGFEDDPAEMWNWLYRFHMASGLGSLIALWGKFSRIRKAEGVTIRAHIANIRTLADQLKRLGDGPSDALTIAVIFGSLPPSYHQLIVSLNSHLLSGDLNFIIIHILNKDLTQQHLQPLEVTAGAFNFVVKYTRVLERC